MFRGPTRSTLQNSPRQVRPVYTANGSEAKRTWHPREIPIPESEHVGRIRSTRVVLARSDHHKVATGGGVTADPPYTIPLNLGCAKEADATADRRLVLFPLIDLIT
jgi:hypothetical protein